jgi:hypothetical protein
MARPRKTQKLEVGLRHGHLTIVRDLGNNKGHFEYECLCDCGATAKLRHTHFYPSRLYCTRSCPLQQRLPDLIKKTFGAWKVVQRVKGDRDKWKCVCVCGSEREIETYGLISGSTQSCGCVGNQKRRKYHTPQAKLNRKREVSRLSARKHASRVKAAKIRYEAKLKRATPSWLTKEDWSAMDAIYAEARRLSRETGVRHEVDHIVPLNGRFVTGLHVPSNLQILTQSRNVAKSNRYAELSGD